MPSLLPDAADVVKELSVMAIVGRSPFWVEQPGLGIVDSGAG